MSLDHAEAHEFTRDRLHEKIEALEDLVRDFVKTCEVPGCYGWFYDEMRGVTHKEREQARELLPYVYPSCFACAKREVGVIDCIHCKQDFCPACYDKHECCNKKMEASGT